MQVGMPSEGGLRLSEQRRGRAGASGTAGPAAMFVNPDAPTGPGPEPSLAAGMAAAVVEDAFETGAPPFDDGGPDHAMSLKQDTKLIRRNKAVAIPSGEL